MLMRMPIVPRDKIAASLSEMEERAKKAKRVSKTRAENIKEINRLSARTGIILGEVVNTIMSVGAPRDSATTHSTHRTHVAQVVGSLYKGDWCSFVAPFGYTVVSKDNNLVVLQKVVSPDLWVQLTVTRAEDVGSSDHTLKDVLNWYTDRVEKKAQGSGHAGGCAGAATDMIDGLRGRTAHNTRMYDYPYMSIFGYAWGENDDVVVMSLCWFGSQVPHKGGEYLTEPLGVAYRSFKL